MANNKIQLKRSLTSGNVPSAALDQGELAINIPDHRIFTKDESNAVVDVFGQSLNTTAVVSFSNGTFNNIVANTGLNADVVGANTLNVLVGANVASLNVGSVSSGNTTITGWANISSTLNVNNILTVKAPDVDNANIAVFYSNTSSRGTFAIRNGSTTNPTTFIGTTGAGEQLGIGTASAEHIRVTATGNTGLGNTSPNHKLSVNGTAYFGSSVNVATTFAAGNSTIAGTVKVNGVDGNATNEYAVLSVSGATDTTKTINLAYDNTNDAGVIAAVDAGTGWKNIAVAPNGGNVGIGNTSPNHKLSVGGTSYFGSAVNVAATFAAGNTTITGFANVNGDVAISGNLTVSGTATYINTNQLNIGDNIFVLNADIANTTAPTEDGGLTINRGNAANVSLLWNETTDKWDIGNTNIVGSANVSGTLNVVGAINRDPNITVTLTNDVTGTANATLTNLANGSISVTTTLASTGVTPGTYGNNVAWPVIDVDTKGRVTAIYQTGAVLTGDRIDADPVWYPGNNTLYIHTVANNWYTTITEGNTTSRGVVYVVDAISNTGATVAASANSVKTAYDVAIAANTAAYNAQQTANEGVANTTVVPGTYGNSSVIPTIVVDSRGRITSVSNNSVAGVSGFSYAAANNTFTITTGAGTTFAANIAANSLNAALTDTGVVASTYGNTTAIPVITIDAKGRITSSTTSSVSGVTGVTWTSANNTLTVATSTTNFTANLNSWSAPVTFSSTVAAGNTTITGFANVIGNTQISDTLTTNNVVITGNLTVSGTTTYVNSTQLNIGDNLIVLNADVTNVTAPTEDAGIIVNRGSSANVQFNWDETNDRWSIGNTYVTGTLATGNTTITGFANVSTTLQVTGVGTFSNAISVAGNAAVDTISFATTPTQAGGVSRLQWNDTDGTLEFGLKGGNTTLQIGQEQVIRVTNQSGGTINNGSAVYITGAIGQRPTVNTAIANSDAYTATFIGLATEPINNNNQGFVTIKGLVRGLNTSALTEGAVVWVSPTVAGGLTTTKPTAPQHSCQVGICVYQHATNGIILVEPQNGYELGELHDVYINAVANNDFIQWDGVNNRWANKSAPTINGALTVSNTASVGNTTITGWANVTVGVNTAVLSIGTSFIANTVGAYHTGTVNAASFTTTGTTSNTSGIYPASNTVGTALGSSTQRWILVANTGTFAGAVSGITTLAAGNTTITGFANVTGTIQGGSSLTVAGALSGVTTAAMGNTTITGFANVSTTLMVGTNTATFGTAAYIVANGNVGIANSTPVDKLRVEGSFSAVTKSFLINHPTKPGATLRYGSLEGPENGVYVRGRLTGSDIIELPDYWTKLVRPETITVNLTPIGKNQNIFVKSVEGNRVVVGQSGLFKKNVDCYYTVYGERADVEKLEVEVK